MTYESAHRPAIQKGQQYVQWTDSHQEAAQGMPPCAVRLWQNLLTKYPGGVPQEIELEEVRYEISAGRGKVYSVQSLKGAMKCLIERDLLSIVKKFTARVFRVIANHAGAIKPLVNKFAKPQDNLRSPKEICETRTSNPNAVVPSYKELKIQQTSDVVALSNESEYPEPIEPYPVCSKLSIKQVKAQPTTIDHLTIISEKRINEVQKLGVEVISSALRKRVIEAEPKVLSDAIALVKEAINGGGVRCPGAYLYKAIAEGWSKGTVRDKRQEEFDEAYQQLIEAGIAKDVPARHLDTLMGETLVFVFDASGRDGVRKEAWREATLRL